jgi:hypothetical protein
MLRSSIFILVLLITPSLILGASAEEIVQIINKKSCALSRSLSLSEVKDHAGIIFSGRFVNSEMIEDSGSLKRITLKFTVKEPIKGLNSSVKELTLYQWANLENHFLELDKNKDYTFCFYAPSPNSGLSSLVGGKQGILP